MFKQKKRAIDEKYSHRELPPVKNRLVYAYRAFIKLFFYFFFGTGSLFLALAVFPWIRLFVHPKKKFQTAARAYVSHTFRFFVNFMRVAGAARLQTAESEKFRNLHSKVLVANHPSMLDFVFIMSLVPNANCIVRGGLTKTVLAGVIRQAYIVNTLDFEELCRRCKETLDDGNNVIIFPEGTRTPRHGPSPYKKGAARIAHYARSDIQPILVGGNDKYGLGKCDPWWSYNHAEEYLYDLSLLPEIKIADYASLPESLAAKRITEKMQETINAALTANDSRYITNRDQPPQNAPHV